MHTIPKTMRAAAIERFGDSKKGTGYFMEPRISLVTLGVSDLEMKTV